MYSRQQKFRIVRVLYRFSCWDDSKQGDLITWTKNLGLLRNILSGVSHTTMKNVF